MDFKNVISVLILSLSLHIIAQDTPGNLQFNRVVNYTLDFSTGTITGNPNDGHGIVSTFSVPVGKVWKIISVFVGTRDNNRGNSVSSVHSGCNLTANRNVLYSPSGSGNSVNFPLWLSSGSYELYGFDCNSAALTISAIEFNIVN